MFVTVNDPTPAHHYQPGPWFPLKSALGVLPFMGLDKCVTTCTHHYGASRVALVVKNPASNAGDIGDAGYVLESGRAPGGGQGNSVFVPGGSHGQRNLAGYSPRSKGSQRVGRDQSNLAQRSSTHHYSITQSSLTALKIYLFL